MLTLIGIITLPLKFIGVVLVISVNKLKIYAYQCIDKIQDICYTLEEKYFSMPYVLEKYFSHLIDIRKNLPSFIINKSYWYENIEIFIKIKKEMERIQFNKINTKIGVGCSIIVFILLLMIWSKFKRMNLNYQNLSMLRNPDLFELYALDVLLGLDALSLPFILLTGFIMPIVYFSNWTTIDQYNDYYVIIVLGLEVFLLGVFLVIDLLMFYVFFESILPLLFVLIGLYGAAQKFRAGYYLFLYTLLGSLFMLLSFVKLSGDTVSTLFECYAEENSFQFLQQIVWTVLFVSFSVKTPLIPVHIWLPLAHSDANVSGSIILASIVLKLALYGFIRILIGIFYLATSRLTSFFYGYCSMSLLFSSFTTIRQFDLKVLVAYSSIAHMASSLLGTFSDTLYGLIGSIIFGLAHGFVSPGLFIIVGAVLYDRCGTRIINYFKGLSNILPFLALIFLILVFGNMGVPLTGNFIGEFMSLIGAYQQNMFIATLGTISVVTSAIYSINTFNKTTSGSISPYIHTIPDIFRKEYYTLLPLIVLTIILGIYPGFIISDIEFGLSSNLMLIPLMGGNNKSNNGNENNEGNNEGNNEIESGSEDIDELPHAGIIPPQNSPVLSPVKPKSKRKPNPRKPGCKPKKYGGRGPDSKPQGPASLPIVNSNSQGPILRRIIFLIPDKMWSWYSEISSWGQYILRLVPLILPKTPFRFILLIVVLFIVKYILAYGPGCLYILSLPEMCESSFYSLIKTIWTYNTTILNVLFNDMYLYDGMNSNVNFGLKDKLPNSSDSPFNEISKMTNENGENGQTSTVENNGKNEGITNSDSTNIENQELIRTRKKAINLDKELEKTIKVTEDARRTISELEESVEVDQKIDNIICESNLPQTKLDADRIKMTIIKLNAIEIEWHVVNKGDDIIDAVHRTAVEMKNNTTDKETLNTLNKTIDRVNKYNEEVLDQGNNLETRQTVNENGRNNETPRQRFFIPFILVNGELYFSSLKEIINELSIFDVLIQYGTIISMVFILSYYFSTLILFLRNEIRKLTKLFKSISKRRLIENFYIHIMVAFNSKQRINVILLILPVTVCLFNCALILIPEIKEAMEFIEILNKIFNLIKEPLIDGSFEENIFIMPEIDNTPPILEPVDSAINSNLEDNSQQSENTQNNERSSRRNYGEVPAEQLRRRQERRNQWRLRRIRRNYEDYLDDIYVKLSNGVKWQTDEVEFTNRTIKGIIEENEDIMNGKFCGVTDEKMREIFEEDKNILCGMFRGPNGKYSDKNLWEFNRNWGICKKHLREYEENFFWLKMQRDWRNENYMGAFRKVRELKSFGDSMRSVYPGLSQTIERDLYKIKKKYNISGNNNWY